MAEKKVGRPSKARERTAEILKATATVVSRHGLASTTLTQVATVAGLQRSLVLHYFGSRDSLIQAFVNEAVAAYGSALLRIGSEEPLATRIETAFAAGAYQNREDLVVWSELIALGARDAGVRQRLRELWATRWLPDLDRQLTEQYPHATPQAISAASYGLACLFEAHWAFYLQDIAGPERERQARDAAHAILDSLAAPAPRRARG